MKKQSKSLMALAKEFDAFARALYVAGRLGLSQKSAERPFALFNKVSPIWNTQNLVPNARFSDRDDITEEWISKGYSGLLESSVKVILKHFPHEEYVARGLSAEDVLMSIIAGYTPVKLRIRKTSKLYDFGVLSGEQKTLYSVESTGRLLSKSAAAVCEAVLNIEYLKELEEDYVYLHSEPDTIKEDIREYIIDSSFRMKSKSLVESHFRGDWIKRIWDVITDNPDLIDYKPNSGNFSINAIETAKAINKKYGLDRELNKVYITFVGGQWRKYRDQVIALLQSVHQQGKLAKTVNVQLKVRELESLVWALESAVDLYSKLDRPDIRGFNKKRIKELLFELQKRAIEL